MNTPETHEFYDLAVIGGGLAGLYAAARAAREGKRVVLYEAGTKLGGRARSPALSDGVVANLGPRGLYRGGQAERAFKALGVSFHGGRPPASGSYRLGGDLFAFPSMAAMAMPMLAGGDGPVDGKALRGVRKAVFSARSESKAPEDARTVGQWLDEKDIRGTARKFVRAMIRLTTYTLEVESLPSALACRQLTHGLTAGVSYLDGGWASLVDGLAAAARKAGCSVVLGASVESLTASDEGISVQTEFSNVRARNVIVALPPGRAGQLLGSPVLPGDAVSIQAACLDLAFRSDAAPSGVRGFGLGFDEPLYFSTHSATAERKGGEFGKGVVVHAMLNLPPGDSRTPDQRKAVLEGFAEQMLPSYRSALIGERFLPNMTVAHCQPALPERRPAPASQPMPGVYLVGDYLRTRAFLLDGCVESVDAALAAIESKRAEAA